MSFLLSRCVHWQSETVTYFCSVTISGGEKKWYVQIQTASLYVQPLQMHTCSCGISIKNTPIILNLLIPNSLSTVGKAYKAAT